LLYSIKVLSNLEYLYWQSVLVMIPNMFLFFFPVFIDTKLLWTSDMILHITIVV
jgi:hypothetical protein